MKYLKPDFTSAMLAILFLLAALTCLTGVTTLAQTIETGDIIYSRATTSPNGSCDTAAVWAVGQNGGGDRFITLGLHPRISPDGRLILFKRYDSSIACAPFFNGAPQWWTRNLTTGTETRISQNFRIAFGHFFSPDPNRADSQIIVDDLNALCKMNLDGTNRVCTGIPTLDPIRGAGHLSVRGGDSLIAVQNYDNNVNNVGGLYTLNYNDLLNRQKIPNTTFLDLNPSWSNDGQTIAYALYPSTRSEPYFFTNLFKIQPNGSNKTQLTFLDPPAGDGFSYSLVWTLDNSTLLNAAKLNGVAGIYKISATGGGVLGTIPITPGAAPEWVGGIVPAQPGGGGNYNLLQSVIAGGGETSANGNYSMTSTIGEAIAGSGSANGGYDLKSGFWGGGQSTAPTAGRTPFDFDGDGKSDVSVFRPNNGTWYLLQSTAGFTGAAFGISTDRIVPADYDGDGKTDLAVYRGGTWYLQRSQAGFTGITFGDGNDIPQPADFDGDGKSELAVFRPANGTWYVLNLTNNQFNAVPFGQSGDKPVGGDYDGDGKADYAVFRPSNGAWYLQRSGLGFTGFLFGTPTDIPVPADYDGDSVTDVAVYRPSSGTWYLQQSTNGFTGIAFGIASDLPAPADYDGDGKADLAVYRGGIWYLLRSTAGFTGVAFGTATDKPVPNAFVP